MSTRIALMLAVIGMLAATAPAVHAATPQTSLPDIEDEVMCPTCGVPLEHAFSPQADRQREFIRSEVAAGKSKQEIKDELVEQFGPRVLAVPADDGFDLTAYIVPIVAVIAALIALALGLVRLRRRSEAVPESADPLASDDAKRLERDLSRYDL